MAVDVNGPVSGHITEVEGVINAVFPPTQEILIDSVNDSITIGDDSGNHAVVTGAGALKVDGSAVTQPVSAASLPLPTGASTSANQSTSNGLLTSILGELGQKTEPSDQQHVIVDSSALPSGAATEITLQSVLTELQGKTEPADQQHVIVDSSALPSGAATAANQVTANASLSSIDGKLTSPLAVTGPLTDTQLRLTPVPISGTVTSVPSGTQTVTGTVTANLGTIAGVATEATLSALNTKIPASPSQEHTTAASPNAARLSDGSSFYKATTPSDTQPISAASLPLPSGASTEATLSALNAKVTAVNTGAVVVSSSALPTGAATAANQATANASLSSIDSKLTSPLTVTGPLTDTQLRASPVPISGTITSTPSGTQTVTGTVTANLGTIAGVATETTLSTLNGKIANNYGVSTGAVRTASQIGNVLGAADFNSGASGAQTLRTAANAYGTDGSTQRQIATDTSGQTKVVGSILEVSGTGAVLNATPIIETDVSRFKSISLQITGTFDATYIFEGRNDASAAFQPVPGEYNTNTAILPFTGGTAGGIINIPIHFKFFRLRLSTYNSGTLQAFAVMSTNDGMSINARGMLLYNAATSPADFGVGTPGTATIRTSATPSGANPDGTYVSGRQSGIVTSNSSTANLGAGAAFTGAWVDTTGFSNLAVTVFSSHASATDGLSIQFSDDGSTQHDQDLYTIPAANGQSVTIGLAWNYFRIVYTNGGTLTTTLRLKSKLFTEKPKASSHRIGDVVSFESDAELVKANLTGFNLTAASPTAATVGITSASALSANTSRKGLILTNTSNNKISFGLGATAVLNSGITLYPGGTWTMDAFNFTTAQINAIAAAASSNLAIQEFS